MEAIKEPENHGDVDPPSHSTGDNEMNLKHFVGPGTNISTKYSWKCSEGYRVQAAKAPTGQG